jgi:hypothetical protein
LTQTEDGYALKPDRPNGASWCDAIILTSAQAKDSGLPAAWGLAESVLNACTVGGRWHIEGTVSGT